MCHVLAPEVDCKRRENGPQPDPRSKCSNRYFMCSNGITTDSLDPRDPTYFHKASKPSDFFRNAFEGAGKVMKRNI